MEGTMSKRVSLALVVGAALGVAACGSSNGRGEQGRVHLRFASDDLFIAPYPWGPLMLGTHEGVLVQETRDVPVLTASSDNGGVFAVTSQTVSQRCCRAGNCTALSTADACTSGGGAVETQTRLEINTVGLGTAQLVLRRADGTEYDRVPVEVRAPAAMRLTSRVNNSADSADATGVTVNAGRNFSMTAAITDSAGEPLQARYGFRVSSSDLSVATVREPGIGHPDPGGGVGAISFTVFGTALRSGTARVTFAAGALESSLQVTVR
jgi:hypothetical protein